MEKILKVLKVSRDKAIEFLGKESVSLFIKKGDEIYIPKEGKGGRIHEALTYREAREEIHSIIANSADKRIYSYNGCPAVRGGIEIIKYGIGRSDSHNIFRDKWITVFDKFFSSGLIKFCVIRKGKKDIETGKYFYSSMGFFNPGIIIEE